MSTEECDNVVVVTNAELGWDCVIGVFDTKDQAILAMNIMYEYDKTEEDYQDEAYFFHDVRRNTI